MDEYRALDIPEGEPTVKLRCLDSRSELAFTICSHRAEAWVARPIVRLVSAAKGIVDSHSDHTLQMAR